MTDHTHDPALESWVAAANAPDALFPIQNLPFAVLRRAGTDESFRPAVAIGDCALDLRALHASGVVSGAAIEACAGHTLDALMALGCEPLRALRLQLSALLAADAPQQQAVATCLLPLDALEYALPATIGDYTDFYTSIQHATNVGRLFRPDNPLLPNYRWLPIGYHGRSSSIQVSGQAFPRPVGQLKPVDSDEPVVGPCERLDYELEVGIFVGAGNALGSPVSIDDAEAHVFGLCLLNDWSARDVQKWEYQPLGPFLAKSFATTLSPWIVTLDALEPFRAPLRRAAEDPDPLPYLHSAGNAAHGAFDLELEVLIRTARMRDAGAPAERLSTSNYAQAYWTVAQLVTHHTMNGCNLRPGDLLGSGTISGDAPGSEGALIEITRGGREPVTLGNGEERRFLEDGDEIVLRAHARREGWRAIGFGEATGRVLPAR